MILRIRTDGGAAGATTLLSNSLALEELKSMREAVSEGLWFGP